MAPEAAEVERADALALLDRFRIAGDQAAFDELVARYAPFVRGVCRRQLLNDADAEDAAQEVFLTLLRNVDQVRANVGAWLHRTSYNISIDLVRRRARRKRIEHNYVQTAQEIARADGVAEALGGDLLQVVDECLVELSDEDREVILETLVHNTPQRELAARRGVTQQAVAKHAARALGRLRFAVGRRGLQVTGAALAAALGHAGAGAVSSATAATVAASTGAVGALTLWTAGRTLGALGVAILLAALPTDSQDRPTLRPIAESQAPTLLASAPRSTTVAWQDEDVATVDDDRPMTPSIRRDVFNDTSEPRRRPTTQATGPSQLAHAPVKAPSTGIRPTGFRQPTSGDRAFVPLAPRRTALDQAAWLAPVVAPQSGAPPTQTTGQPGNPSNDPRPSPTERFTVPTSTNAAQVASGAPSGGGAASAPVVPGSSPTVGGEDSSRSVASDAPSNPIADAPPRDYPGDAPMSLAPAAPDVPRHSLPRGGGPDGPHLVGIGDGRVLAGQKEEPWVHGGPDSWLIAVEGPIDVLNDLLLAGSPVAVTVAFDGWSAEQAIAPPPAMLANGVLVHDDDSLAQIVPLGRSQDEVFAVEPSAMLALAAPFEPSDFDHERRAYSGSPPLPVDGDWRDGEANAFSSAGPRIVPEPATLYVAATAAGLIGAGALLRRRQTTR